MKYAGELKAFGATVKHIRKQRQLTQQALADDAELNLRTIQRIEAGERKIVFDTIVAIAYALEVTPADLFTPPSTPLH